MIYSLENILDLIILVMLAVMIGYCVILNRRLKAFRNIKQELALIINQLNASTSHAQKSIGEFKNIVVAEEKKLTVKLQEAAEMVDELDMINKTGSNLADRIEKGLTGNKAVQTEENLSHAENEVGQSERISLSDLDKQENADDDSGELRESLRNVR